MGLFVQAFFNSFLIRNLILKLNFILQSHIKPQLNKNFSKEKKLQKKGFIVSIVSVVKASVVKTA